MLPIPLVTLERFFYLLMTTEIHEAAIPRVGGEGGGGAEVFDRVAIVVVIVAAAREGLMSHDGGTNCLKEG